MSFKGWGKSTSYSLICEIGSGSVLFSIVTSDTIQAKPVIIWSHREYITDNITLDLNRTAKKIASAITNAGMVLNSKGIEVLTSYDTHAKITQGYVTLSAPWSFTVSKTVRCDTDNKESFLIQKNTIATLIKNAVNSVKDDFMQHDSLKDSISIINQKTVSLKANGYATTSSIGKKVKYLELSHLCALAQTPMVDFVHDIHRKLQPKIEIELFSFMMIFYFVVRDIYPAKQDYCLLDITNEATELAIVRDGDLVYCSHIMTGTHSLAQSIRQETDVPLEVATAFMRDPDETNRYQHLPPKKQEVVAELLAQHQQDILNLFQGHDVHVAIPQTIYLHIDDTFIDFYVDQLHAALQSIGHIRYTVSPVTPSSVSKLALHHTADSNDTAAMITAYFFHTAHADFDFLQN